MQAQHSTRQIDVIFAPLLVVYNTTDCRVWLGDSLLSWFYGRMTIGHNRRSQDLPAWRYIIHRVSKKPHTPIMSHDFSNKKLRYREEHSEYNRA